MKSNSWLMSYVIDGLLGFILFKCSSYILQTPVEETEDPVHFTTMKKTSKLKSPTLINKTANIMPNLFCIYWTKFVVAFIVNKYMTKVDDYMTRNMFN